MMIAIEKKKILVPKELQGELVEVVYSSQIAKAQRATETNNFIRVMEIVGPIAQIQPQILDNVNGDMLLRHTAKIFGVPEIILNTEDVVQSTRQARAQEVQKQKDMMKEQHETEVAEKLGKTYSTVSSSQQEVPEEEIED